MAHVRPERRGVISGALSLSRNLGLITGASLLGAVFAHASGATGVTAPDPASIAAGMRITFTVALILIGVALTLAIGSRRRAVHARIPDDSMVDSEFS